MALAVANRRPARPQSFQLAIDHIFPQKKSQSPFCFPTPFCKDSNFRFCFLVHFSPFRANSNVLLVRVANVTFGNGFPLVKLVGSSLIKFPDIFSDFGY